MKIGKLCKDIKDLKEIILDNFPETELLPDVQDMEFGYIEPGHGLRGKKEWLSMDDVTEMLQIHKDKKEVMLWCYSHKEKRSGRSRSRSPAISERSVPRNSWYDSHLKKVSEVDEIFQKLDERHKGAYTPEQLRAWAHLIHMDKHNSFESPPDKPFFRGYKANKSTTPW